MAAGVSFIVLIVLPFLLNWLFRKRIGRYLSYILAFIVSAAIGAVGVYLLPDELFGWDKTSAVMGLLPSYLVLLFWGLIWLRINTFKFAEPRQPPRRTETVSRLAGRIEPVFGPAASSPADPYAGTASDDAPDNHANAPSADIESSGEISRNFFVRYWRGQYSLPFSYWIVGLLGGISILLIIVGMTVLFSMSADYNPYGFFAFIVSLWALLIAWTIWDLVGLWRSATRAMHRRWRQGRHTFWGGLVKLIVVAAVLGGIRTLVEATGPQIYEAYNIAFKGDPNVADYRLRIMRNGTEMEISGGFKYGLTKDVERLLKASPQIRIVHLNSTGGRIGEAIDLHDAIRQRQLTTYVANECDSACTVAFAGGKERWLGPAGKLGFHAPFFPGMTPEDLSASVARQRAIFMSDGFTAEFVTRALSTPATSLWTPTTMELRQGGAITDIASIDTFAMSGFGAEVTPAEAGKILTDMYPMIEPLKAREPDLVNAVTQLFYQMYLDGGTFSEFSARFNEQVGPVIKKYFVLGDDETQLRYIKLTADKYRYLAGTNVQACYAYISATGTPPPLPREFGRRERDLEAQMILTAAPRPPAPKAVLEQAWTNVSNLLQAGPQARNTHLFNTSPRPDQLGDFCLLYVALNDAILQLPPQQGAMIAREMLSER